ncbi:hypothetical protein Acr_03g0001600 [Actinidia rufa]|uniref:Uncharacterized protein n=1 Tax=Actinidia rufa TaxID=165716 RepID=A0A7J0EB24_9ERIC|nr:hypothetical protein Acr_03g0001600 [Actinidia rufa]
MGNRQLKRVIELSATPAIDLEGTPIRAIFCLKKKKLNMREIEEREDCFILDFDPNVSLNLSQISKSKDLLNPNSPDLSVVCPR